MSISVKVLFSRFDSHGNAVPINEFRMDFDTSVNLQYICNRFVPYFQCLFSASNNFWLSLDNFSSFLSRGDFVTPDIDFETVIEFHITFRLFSRLIMSPLLDVIHCGKYIASNIPLSSETDVLYTVSSAFHNR